MTIKEARPNSSESAVSTDLGERRRTNEPNVEQEETDDNDNDNVRVNATIQQNEETPASNGEDLVGAEQQRKIDHWRDSAFAVGCVNVTWEDDQPSWWCLNSRIDSADSARVIDQQFPVSSIVCGCLGADRVGNMAVLAQTTEVFEEEMADPESGEVTTHRKKRPKLLWVVGPYWTVNMFVTFPLIFGVSGWMCYSRVIGSGLVIIISWSIGTFLMVFSLCMISCRNPGILYRHSQIPPNTEEDWRWNDQARTYRPASSRFDSDCQVVVEGFDHTCPWTGTAIGSANMFWFRLFVGSILVMLIYTLMLATFSGFLRFFP
mmetsp:Transcript_790/g.1665  ORF Transcript_790/g.1665 Transcript_790/m.1665 type:complete len:319 (+) Transcript_790:77-1033(+)